MSICYHSSQTQFLPTIFFFHSKRNKGSKEYEYAIKGLDSYFPPTGTPECGAMSATAHHNVGVNRFLSRKLDGDLPFAPGNMLKGAVCMLDFWQSYSWCQPCISKYPCSSAQWLKPLTCMPFKCIAAHVFHVHVLILSYIFPQQCLWHMEAKSFLEKEVSERKCVKNRMSVSFFWNSAVQKLFSSHSKNTEVAKLIAMTSFYTDCIYV